ncbi:methyltransferase [Martelella alba]|uniref:Methyltransferase n=1 Tax=Martelella alba TaxID=2590451 RepID=A0ABY2SMT8_9HYPH|nr:methyltransferase [Martelella alba]TKI07195.1 methyltransferase [Martelella alba]
MGKHDLSGAGNVNDGLYLLEQAAGYAFPAALRVAAELDIAHCLAQGAKTAEELGAVLGIDPGQLRRILRLLATRDIFRETADRQFVLTPAAEFLRSDYPNSLRPAVLMLTDKTLWDPSGRLTECARGIPVFKNLFGMPFFEYWQQPHRPAEDFHAGLYSMSEVENALLIRHYAFPAHSTVVDVAGGFGGMLLRIMQTHPTVRGILFDQRHVLQRHRLDELQDTSRWQLVEGDFFQSCPRGDIYLLKHTLHDWDDEHAMRILENCRKAMAPDGKVLIIDSVIPEGNMPHFSKIMDLLVMSCLEGARERTVEELEHLLAGAGLRLNQVIDTGFYMPIVEAMVI